MSTINLINGIFHVSVDIAAQICGVTHATMLNWRKQPNPPPYNQSHDLYPLTELGDWIRTQQIFKAGKGGSYPWKPDMSRFGPVTSLPGTEKETQKDRVERLRGDKIQMELEEKAGRLVNADEVEIAWSNILSRVKMRILSVPMVVSPTVSGISDENEISVVIENEIREALEELVVGWRSEIETGEE